MSEVTIHLHPAGKVLRVQRGIRLQDILFEHGVEFPCGGKGRCKGCRIRLLEGSLPIHSEEQERLSSEELEQGWRLACLGRVEADLTIELAQWEAKVLTDHSSFRFHPRPGAGVAIDLGTTTIAAQLVDLATGNVLGVETALNSQARHGADIMSRVEYAVSQEGGELLCRLARGQVGEMIGRLVRNAGIKASLLSDVVVVGNTVMHHLFCDLNLEPLSHYPFEPTASGLHEFSVQSLGWDFSGNPTVRFLPCLGGFVGSDILAGIVATGMNKSDKPCALMDLGTNGEIVVGTKERMLCASTAAGPAFEGARISAGMRAATGAISEVRVVNGALECHALGNALPRGICGSGLVDAAAAGRELNLILESGRFAGGDTLPLAGAVVLTQWDIRELQMAKGAIAAGLKLLLSEFGIRPDDLSALYLAGAFGNYINLASGVRIGLLGVEGSRIRPSGNTALLGAKMDLFNTGNGYGELLRRVRHVSLNELDGFQDTYVEEMRFP